MPREPLYCSWDRDTLRSIIEDYGQGISQAKLSQKYNKTTKGIRTFLKHMDNVTPLFCRTMGYSNSNPEPPPLKPQEPSVVIHRERKLGSMLHVNIVTGEITVNNLPYYLKEGHINGKKET